MWISIIGPAGTCKNTVAEALTKEGFSFLKSYKLIPMAALRLEMAYLTSRYGDSLDIAKEYEQKDIITVHSFWDTIAYIEAAMEVLTISHDEYMILKMVYSTLQKTAAIPHGVIFLKPKSQVQSSLRSSFTGTKFNDAFEGQLSIRYAEHIKKVGIPKIELEVSDDFQIMLSEIVSGINSFRASQVGGASIWKRSYYK